MTYIRSAIGAVEVIAISDATLQHPIPLERLFPTISEEDWGTCLQRYPGAFAGPGAWRANMGCYLLRSEGKNILVDAGIGPAGGLVATTMEVPGGGPLLRSLEAVGLRPDDIHVVIYTHPHRDHVGWTVTYHGETPHLTFPNARYLVQQADWDTFQQPAVQKLMGPYFGQVVVPLKVLGGLELIEGDYQITGGIKAIHTPGHTPGHMIIQISSGGQTAIITGDVLVNPAQVADAGCIFYFDMDRDAAGRARHALLDRIETEQVTVIGGHFPAPGMGRLIRENGRRVWQPVL